jgi:anthranilate synthase component 2
MLDNYDSFTYNLVHYLEQFNAEVIVKKNDQVTLGQIERLAPTHIIISPGPKTPDQAGISLELVEHFKGCIPILGVCLGHQVIGQLFGASVTNAATLMHGKTSTIHHNDHGIFTGIPQGFIATRYHSLVLDKKTLPDDIELTAWTVDENGEVEEVMGIKHRKFNIEGVQFHPESVLSEYGMDLLKAFVFDSNKN